jgi:hypothetical protein
MMINMLRGQMSTKNVHKNSCDRGPETGAAYCPRGSSASRPSRLPAVDFMIAKVIPIRENMRFQFRSEYFNLFDRVNLGPPNLDTQVPATFGKIFTAGDPRILQFGLKLQF